MYQNVAGSTTAASGGASLAATGGGNVLTILFTALICAAVGYALFNLAPKLRRRG